MTNILLSKHDIGKKWCAKDLKRYIRKGDKVAVVALSYDYEISSREDWDKFYGVNGIMSAAIEDSLGCYGVDPQSIEYVDYFRDAPSSARNKVLNANVIYFPGGAADNIMTRVILLDLYSVIENHKGLVIGFGAGARVQLANYRIVSGGRMYYSLGFRFADGFDVEPNYTSDEAQNYYINKAVSERGLPVYAIGEEGAVIVENGIPSVIGDVRCFRKRETA